jgi:hypothetical protein
VPGRTYYPPGARRPEVSGIAQLATQYPRAEFVISGVLNDKEATAFLAAYSGALSSGLSSGTRELFEVIRQRQTVFPAFHRSDVIEATLNVRQVRVTALSPVPAAFAQFIARVAEYSARKDEPIHHAPELRPNTEAVALHVDLGDDAALLGASPWKVELFRAAQPL